MVTIKSKDEIIQGFIERVKANIATNCTDVDLTSYMRQYNTRAISDCCLKLLSNVVLAVPEEVGIDLKRRPLLHVSVNGSEEKGITVIVITLSSRISAAKKFKYSFSATQYNTKESIVDFITRVFVDLIVDDLATSNLVRVNEVLSEATKDAGLDYSVVIESPMSGKGKKLSYISDDEIHFVADIDRVFELNDLLILKEEETDVIKEEDVLKAYDGLVAEIAECQTTPQLVSKKGTSLISYICDISKRADPMSMIKKVTSRNWESRRDNYSKDMIFYSVVDGTFALIALSEGNAEYLLHPFTVENYRPADVDILEA